METQGKMLVLLMLHPDAVYSVPCSFTLNLYLHIFNKKNELLSFSVTCEKLSKNRYRES